MLGKLFAMIVAWLNRVNCWTHQDIPNLGKMLTTLNPQSLVPALERGGALDR